MGEIIAFNDILKKLETFNLLKKELSSYMEPKLHVCTQSARHIVAVYDFYVEDAESQYIFASHNAEKHFDILGVYTDEKRVMQIYEEMLQHSKENPNKIFQMPKE